MAFLTLNQISLGFGGPALLERIDLEIAEGERICLLGRNGAGKSSLMKIIADELSPDAGRIRRAPEVRTAFLTQEIPENLTGAVVDVLDDGRHHDWERHARVETAIARLGLAPDSRVETLSAGLKRRLLLARSLVDRPSLLLLDEPTNHLDLDSVLRLEEDLLEYPGALLFVTHDRRFLQRLATRILDLDRGRLTSWKCDYETFLARREAQLEEEARHEAAFDRRLAKEEAWLRQGIKARRTRNEGRVRALKAMREERRQRREREGAARLETAEADRSGEKVIDAEDVFFSYDGRPVIANFSTRIMRGDRVGILGPNGAGKTTLLRLLLGQLAPERGHVTLGSNLHVAYFDQLRAQLDGEKTVQENVAGERESIEIQGRSRHAIGYLQDFLFTPERARSRVKSLSGGERNRLLLARLFSYPFNLLVLDEPTNDLDMETLELLEEQLMDFGGTLLLVSHDRTFLNNVVTQLLVFEGPATLVEYTGGYDDYLRHRPGAEAPQAGTAPKAQRKSAPAPSAKGKPRRFLNRERRELETIPEEIESREAEQAALSERLADPALYRDNPGELQRTQEQLAVLQTELEKLYRRWEELEARRESLES